MAHHQDNDTIALSRIELQEMLNEAAEVGGRKALAAIGLGDEHAGRDIEGLRDFMRAWELMKTTALKSIVRTVVNFIAITFFLGVAVKLGIKIGGG